MRLTSKNSEAYPIVLIPEKIISAIENDISIENIMKEITLEAPIDIKYIENVYPPNEYNYSKQNTIYYQNNGEVYGLTIVVIVTLILGFFTGPEMIPFMLLSIAPFLILNFLFNLKSKKITIKSKKTSKEIELLNQEYMKKKFDIEIKNKIIEDKNASSQKTFNEKLGQLVSEYRVNYYIKQLAPNKESVRNQEKITRGKSEIIFLKSLLNRFGRKIQMDTTPDTYKKYYYPDFTYICELTNLHIDIEIDEPYSFTDKTPIHYIGSRDESRNEYFLSYNWVVIRFSEKQIIQEADNCIELIKNVVDSILKKQLLINNPVQLQNRWSYEEALLMAANNERSLYR